MATLEESGFILNLKPISNGVLNTDYTLEIKYKTQSVFNRGLFMDYHKQGVVNFSDVTIKALVKHHKYKFIDSLKSIAKRGGSNKETVINSMANMMKNILDLREDMLDSTSSKNITEAMKKMDCPKEVMANIVKHSIR